MDVFAPPQVEYMESRDLAISHASPSSSFKNAALTAEQVGDNLRLTTAREAVACLRFTTTVHDRQKLNEMALKQKTCLELN